MDANIHGYWLLEDTGIISEIWNIDSEGSLNLYYVGVSGYKVTNISWTQQGGNEIHLELDSKECISNLYMEFPVTFQVILTDDELCLEGSNSRGSFRRVSKHTLSDVLTSMA
jgi:hypothetical protein